MCKCVHVLQEVRVCVYVSCAEFYFVKKRGFGLWRVVESLERERELKECRERNPYLGERLEEGRAIVRGAQEILQNQNYR